MQGIIEGKIIGDASSLLLPRIHVSKVNYPQKGLEPNEKFRELSGVLYRKNLRRYIDSNLRPHEKRYHGKYVVLLIFCDS